MLWLVEMGEPPNLLSNKMVELRNQVIHQGKIPIYQNCIEFGQAVIDVISPIEGKILDRFPASYKDQYSGQFFERFCKAFRVCSSRVELFYQS